MVLVTEFSVLAFYVLWHSFTGRTVTSVSAGKNGLDNIKTRNFYWVRSHSHDKQPLKSNYLTKNKLKYCLDNSCFQWDNFCWELSGNELNQITLPYSEVCYHPWHSPLYIFPDFLHKNTSPFKAHLCLIWPCTFLVAVTDQRDALKRKIILQNFKPQSQKHYWCLTELGTLRCFKMDSVESVQVCI